MSRSCDYAELGELILACLSGEADRDQMVRLEARLAGDAEARRYYGEFLVIYAGLHQLPASLLGSVVVDEVAASDERDRRRAMPIHNVGRGARQNASEDADEDLQTVQFADDEATRAIESYARRQLEAFLEQQHREERLRQRAESDWDFAAAATSVACAARRCFRMVVRAAKVGAAVATIALTALIIGLHIHANRVVATLTDSAEAVWEMAPAEPRLRRGWMRLEQGFAQITFGKGAQVILQGPCEFELCSTNAMFLEDGRVTARVPQSAAGFTVSTPASRVIDFGTEFGLLTGGGRGDEVHVFDGQVRFKSARRRRSRRWDESLKKGQAATIDAAGQVHVQPLENRATQFVRAIPDANASGRPAGQLNLADIVGGGSGRGRRSVGRGIDPSNGAIVSAYNVMNAACAGFLETPSLAFVDGVFVPDGGEGPVVISSTGAVFAECPDTSGRCYRSIVNGAMFQAMPFARHPGRLADPGPDAVAKTGASIGMHANAGITFDLENIRRTRPGLNIVAFRALSGVSETVADYANEGNSAVARVTFWVLVDGDVRFSATLGAIPPQSEWIDVELTAQDRFLTLATTGFGACTFGWGMFAEPALELETQ